MSVLVMFDLISLLYSGGSKGIHAYEDIEKFRIATGTHRHILHTGIILVVLYMERCR